VLADFIGHIVGGENITVSDAADHIPGLEAGLLRGRALNHIDNQYTLIIGEPQLPGNILVDILIPDAQPGYAYSAGGASSNYTIRAEV
jgi:hypothetical protein